MEPTPPCPDCNGKSKRRVNGFRCLSCSKIWPEKKTPVAKGFLARGVEILYCIFWLLVFLIVVYRKISN
jgi:tRNA(Ile2) C34 agmatinyltransferase TiaS